MTNFSKTKNVAILKQIENNNESEQSNIKDTDTTKTQNVTVTLASEHATLESNTKKDVSDIMSTFNEDRYDTKDSNSMSNKEPTKAIFNKNVQNIDEYISLNETQKKLLENLYN